jgi:hypothetical protein
MKHLKVEPILRCIKCHKYPEVEINAISEEFADPAGTKIVYYHVGLKCPCGRKASGVDHHKKWAVTEAFVDWTVSNLP